MSKKLDLKLSEAPDQYGFFYGTAQLGEQFSRVNVLPPRAQWAGGEMLEGYKPDDKKWIVYADGEEIARMEKRADIAGALLPALKKK